MLNDKLQDATRAALSDHTKLFGHYLINSNDVMKIVELVIRELGVLSTAECQQCISELIAAASQP